MIRHTNGLFSMRAMVISFFFLIVVSSVDYAAEILRGLDEVEKSELKTKPVHLAVQCLNQKNGNAVTDVIMKILGQQQKYISDMKQEINALKRNGHKSKTRLNFMKDRLKTLEKSAIEEQKQIRELRLALDGCNDRPKPIDNVKAVLVSDSDGNITDIMQMKNKTTILRSRKKSVSNVINQFTDITKQSFSQTYHNHWRNMDNSVKAPVNEDVEINMVKLIKEKDMKAKTATNTICFNRRNRKLQSISVDIENIAFSAYLTHTIPVLSPGHIVKCDRILLNDGNGYNIFTGVFTVPISGVYLLTFTLDNKDQPRRTHVKLVVDDREIVAAMVFPTASGEDMGGNIAITRLNQGESLWLESFHNDSGGLVSDIIYRYVTFSGVRLY